MSRADVLCFWFVVSISLAPGFSLFAAVRYVDANGVNPTPPYLDWSVGATNIQDAIDAAEPGDTVLVTNGIYAFGQKVVNGYLTNRVAVTKRLSVESVNGPQVTVIEGLSNALRCVYLTNGASLSGFTLTNGDATIGIGGSGGGIWCESSASMISNCIVTMSRAISGGGVFRGTLSNCVLSNNLANDGGGAFWAALNNCTVVSNSAYRFGGGAAKGTLSDCVILGNSATNRDKSASGGGTYQGILSRCSLSNNFAAAAGGGSSFGMLANCNLAANVAGAVGGGAYDGMLISCQMIGNSAPRGGGVAWANLGLCTVASNYATDGGGGAYNCTLNACLLANNSVDLDHGSTFGGGAYLGALTNCTLSGNSAYFGGGAESAILENCTLTNNRATEGGGVHYATLNACRLSGNSAGMGGGASQATLANCILTGNSGGYGGASVGATLLGCTVISNSSPFGGGVYGGTSTNCIIYFNESENFYDDDVFPWYSPTRLDYCCTTPVPAAGVENIINPPLFVDLANNDLRLQSNSPCINAGQNVSANGSLDLGGQPRVSGGTVDIGAYEFQNPASIISYAWLQQFGLPMSGASDFADPDGDGMSNWQEWRCGTDPTNAASVLKLSAPDFSTNPSGLVITWSSVSNRTYFLQCSTNLAAQPAFFTLPGDIAGAASTTSYVDTNAAGGGSFFYRLGVR